MEAALLAGFNPDYADSFGVLLRGLEWKKLLHSWPTLPCPEAIDSSMSPVRTVTKGYASLSETRASLSC